MTAEQKNLGGLGSLSSTAQQWLLVEDMQGKCRSVFSCAKNELQGRFHNPPPSRETKLKTPPSLPDIIHLRLLYSAICLNVFSYHFLPISDKFYNPLSYFFPFCPFLSFCSSLFRHHLSSSSFLSSTKMIFLSGSRPVSLCAFLPVSFCVLIAICLSLSAALEGGWLQSSQNDTYEPVTHPVWELQSGGRCETGEGDRVANENVSLLCLVIKYGLL